MKVDKIKIINEMDGDIVVRVGVTAYAEEKHVSSQKEIDLMKEIPVDKADELIVKIRKKED